MGRVVRFGSRREGERRGNEPCSRSQALSLLGRLTKRASTEALVDPDDDGGEPTAEGASPAGWKIPS